MMTLTQREIESIEKLVHDEFGARRAGEWTVAGEEMSAKFAAGHNVLMIAIVESQFGDIKVIVNRLMPERVLSFTRPSAS